MDIDELVNSLYEIGEYADHLGLLLGMDFANGTVFLFDPNNDDYLPWFVSASSWEYALDELHYNLLVYGPELE